MNGGHCGTTRTTPCGFQSTVVTFFSNYCSRRKRRPPSLVQSAGSYLLGRGTSRTRHTRHHLLKRTEGIQLFLFNYNSKLSMFSSIRKCPTASFIESRTLRYTRRRTLPDSEPRKHFQVMESVTGSVGSSSATTTLSANTAASPDVAAWTRMLLQVSAASFELSL